MKCRRWILANSQEIISERAAFHYWQSGKSKEIKQTVYYSKISEEAGAVLCRGWLWISDVSGDFYLRVRKHLCRMRLAWLMIDDEEELLIPGPEEAAGVAWALCLAAGKHKGCVPLGSSRWLLPWVPVQGSPSALRLVPEQLRSCTSRLGVPGRTDMRAMALKRIWQGQRGMGSGRGTAQGHKKTRQIVFAVNITAIRNSWEVKCGTWFLKPSSYFISMRIRPLLNPPLGSYRRLSPIM